MHKAGPAAVGPGASPVSVVPAPTQLAKQQAISKQIRSFMLCTLGARLAYGAGPSCRMRIVCAAGHLE